MFAEPSPTPYDLNFRLAGVDVRVHPMFWIVGLLMGLSDPKPVHVLLWMSAVFISIVVHEMGHVLAFGAYRVPSHVVLHAFGGLAVPDRTPPRNTAAEVFIALAGPLAGFALAGVIVVGLALSGRPVQFRWGGALGFSIFPPRLLSQPGEPFDPLTILVADMIFINVFWGLVNLLPVFPLDGGRVARGLLTHANPRDGFRQSLLLSMITAVGVAIFALFRMKEAYLGLMFAYLAFINYQMLQQLTGRGRFGGGPW